MLKQAAYELAEKLQKVRLSGLQDYTGIIGSSSNKSEQLLNFRITCSKLLECVAQKKPAKSEIEQLLSEIDGHTRLAISTGLISGADSEEFMGLVDNLYDELEKL